ncbi:MAG TPA: 6-bladed beta-propeller [Gemmatimonadales bacterium]|nr:6-bladed beta-propeller [Gemmatimonadales bacterium]
MGTRETDPGHELAGVSGARILDGRLIIANSGSSELRAFDTTGAYLGALGRKGQGPGEFTGTIYLFPAPGDSLYTFDGGNLRWSLHSATGQYARVLPSDRYDPRHEQGGAAAVPRATWLYHRTIVESNLPGPVPAWAVAVLDRLPEAAPGGPVRRARFDDLGFLWVADSSSAAWTVFSDSKTRLGTVILPSGFRLMQAGADFVLGVERDTLDREIVPAYSLHRPPGLPKPAAIPTAEFPHSNPKLERSMLADVRTLLMAQEVFYSGHNSYTGRADSLHARLESGAELALVYGDNRHWAGILYDRASRTTCGLSVGFPAPPGWIDGMPFCGR